MALKVLFSKFLICSRSGVFDWLIGRQEEGWNQLRMVSREYAGMSLRGLIWTAPSGYALYYMGYGWHYAVSGSLMGFFYYLGFRTPIDSGKLAPDFSRGIPASEFYWGAWIWMVVLFSSIARVTEHTLKRWERESNTSDVDYPVPSYKRSSWTASKFSRRLPAVLFEFLHIVLNVVFAGSVGFYALVDQPDVKNKGQTFFGMYTASVFLLMAQAFIFGKAWTICWMRKAQRMRVAMATRRGSSGYPEVRLLNPGVRSNQTETATGGTPPTNLRYRPSSSSLASDPFGNPANNAVFNPLNHHEEEPPGYDTAQRVLPSHYPITSVIPEPTVQHADSSSSIGSDHNVQTVIERPRSLAWDYVELLHTITGWIRNLFGVLGVLGVLVVMLFCVIDLIWNRQTARFIDGSLLNENYTHAYEFFSG